MGDPASITVLNVNDDEVARYTSTRMLQRAGFSVVEAASGADALSKVRAQPDVVVLDVKLPDMSGFEVCRQLKASVETATIPVLLTSAAFIKAGDRVHGLEGGADAYLVQPAEAIEMVATVKALVRARRAEDDREHLLHREQLARAQAEAALVEAQEARMQAERANRLKDEFLATVSHELRTPLNAILGWSRMLLSGRVAGEKQARALETIERNARAQIQLVEDLLDVSRILSGKLRVEFNTVDLQAVVSAAVDAVLPTAEARGVRVATALDDDVGAVMGDADRLQQVVWNLVANAVKFTPRGGQVGVRLARVGDEVAIEVADTGLGIRADFLPHVFERFRQADSTISRAHGGLGLGLAIVRHLVELHGGSVEAASDGPGRGATFTARLPRRRAHAEAPRAPEERHDAQRGAALEDMPSLRGLRVLVVDDDDDTRALLAEVLSNQGAEVTAVGSAREALAALALRPDVLVSDIGMPGEDGYELIRQLRERPASQGGEIPAVAVTAFTRGEDRRRALAAGFQRHAPKPLEPGDLVAVVAELAGRRRPQDAPRDGANTR